MHGIGMVLINHDCAYISLCLMKNDGSFSVTDVKNLLSYIKADHTHFFQEKKTKKKFYSLVMLMQVCGW